MAANQLVDTLEAVTHTMQWMARAGWPGFTCSPQALARLNSWDSAGPAPSVSRSLKDVRAALGDCRRCRLAETRRRIVFGSGNPDARLVFVGEAPGYEEDRRGEPFVGPAGQLLTRIIGAIEMTREDVYILNVLKCRPPKNRNPLPEEVAACAPFMAQQIQLIKPDFICALGRFAAQTLLETERPISRLRGRFHDYKGIQLMPTFHPSYLLHHPEKKRDVWQDMQKLMAAMRKIR